jgi:hypothetical protein
MDVSVWMLVEPNSTNSSGRFSKTVIATDSPEVGENVAATPREEKMESTAMEKTDMDF